MFHKCPCAPAKQQPVVARNILAAGATSQRWHTELWETVVNFGWLYWWLSLAVWAWSYTRNDISWKRCWGKVISFWFLKQVILATICNDKSNDFSKKQEAKWFSQLTWIWKKNEGKEALKRCWQRHNSNLYLPDTSYALLITELQLQKRVKSQSLVLFLLLKKPDCN